MELEKAWDVKALVAELKPFGLNVAEDAAKQLVEKVFEFVEKSVVLSENKFDDMTLAVIPMVKPLVLSQLDKIDGEVG